VKIKRLGREEEEKKKPVPDVLEIGSWGKEKKPGVRRRFLEKISKKEIMEHLRFNDKPWEGVIRPDALKKSQMVGIEFHEGGSSIRGEKI